MEEFIVILLPSEEEVLRNIYNYISKELNSESNANDNLRQKALLVKNRKVFDDSGKMIDFGDAYPITTEYGKIMITKKFISVWI